MSDPERRICRYYNTLGGCWYGDKCKFLHVPNKKPPCKFFGSSTGCRFGESCHFSHERTPFKSVENYEDGSGENVKEDFKENMDPSELSGTNNNNMEQPSTNANNASSPTDLVAKDTKEIDVQCGSCKRILERQGSESYCNILKDHYLECFLEKEGDHIKLVKFKASLDPGQMYWCKTCILIFEKPWSLFQHMADKAKGMKVQRWDKKVHLDWLETVAGLMAGYDLGLFSPGKLRTELRNLLADHHTMEEEMEAAAMTAAALMQWFAPTTPTPSNPWRLQQRDMMRKLEQINRQVYRKGGNGNGGVGGGGNRYLQQGGMPPALGGGRGRYLDAIAGVPNSFTDSMNCGSMADMPPNSTSPQLTAANSLPPTAGNVDKDAAAAAGVNGSDTNTTGINNRPSSAAALAAGIGLNNSQIDHHGKQQRGGAGGCGDTAGNTGGNNLNCGFTDEEVAELEAQGIKPWDEEAGAALAALHGDLDYLLE